jgi:hypothetical protein
MSYGARSLPPPDPIVTRNARRKTLMSSREEVRVGDSQSKAADRAGSKWWVAIGDKPEGPHSEAYVALLLGNGSIGPTTLVCRLGEKEWRTVMDVQELVAVAQTQSPGSLPPGLPTTISVPQRFGGFLSRFTNPELPRFANWICVYCIVVVPVFVAVGFLFMIGGLNTGSDLRHDSPLIVYAVFYDVLTLIVDVSLAVVVVIGGLLMRNLRQKGTTLIKAGLALSLAWLAIEILAQIQWSALVALGDQAAPVSEEFTAGEGIILLLSLPFLLVFVAILVFEVIALVWLFKNEHLLPLAGPAMPRETEGHKR